MLSVLPHFGHFLAALTFGRVVDHVRGQALVSTTTARKLLVYICKSNHNVVIPYSYATTVHGAGERLRIRETLHSCPGRNTFYLD